MDDLFNNNEHAQSIQMIRDQLHIIKDQRNRTAIITNEVYRTNQPRLINTPLSHIGILPPIYPEWLGDKAFLQTHQVRFPYIVGEMANGIASAKLVVAAAKVGFLSFFGAAGLMPTAVESNISQIRQELTESQKNWGSNLIHSPQEPALEEKMVNLYLTHQVRKVSASAYLNLTPALVRFACHGLTQDRDGSIIRRNYLFAKVSRPEVARQFVMPAPNKLLTFLCEKGLLTHEETQLAQHIPLAEDITVEADSGGHTDNRPLTALLPTIMALAQDIQSRFAYHIPIRIGAAGGLGTPASIAAAFGLGAAYVLTGSINQCAIESGLSDEAKKLLAQAQIADVAMAPAADMFELGIKLQVLKRGTLFAAKANQLYHYYQRYQHLDALSFDEKQKLEQEILGASINEVWTSTQQFFAQRDPKQLERAKKNPRHQMALVFRWYLGLSSHWAIQGETKRQTDYQIWCGPAMGAFNQWVVGSFLQPLANRSVEQIGRNLLEGAAVLQRVQQLRSFGLHLSAVLFDYRPKYLN